MTFYELCEAKKEETLIYDSNGKKQGKLYYSIRLALTEDKEGNQPVDINLYENVDEAIGKYLQMTIKIRSAEIEE